MQEFLLILDLKNPLCYPVLEDTSFNNLGNESFVNGSDVSRSLGFVVVLFVMPMPGANLESFGFCFFYLLNAAL